MSGSAFDQAKPTSCLSCILVLSILFVLFLVTLGTGGGIYIGPLHQFQSDQVQKAHAIGLALFSYANDNAQMYPDTSSSTEAFQKLLDGGYITDPSIFYIPMPGKVPPKLGQKLKPENVSWDLTAPASSVQASELPLVFMTGYKANYVPGGSASPLHGIPQYGHALQQATWEKWLGLSPKIIYEPSAGIAVFYVNDSTVFRPSAAPNTSPDGSIPNFIDPGYKPDGKTYHQLTPDGVLR